MNKLALVSAAALAASMPALAAAEQTVAPPVPWEEVPGTRLNTPVSPPAPPAGVSWQQRGPRAAAPGPRMRAAPPAPPVHAAAPAPRAVQAHAAQASSTAPVAVVRQARRGFRGGGHGVGKRFQHVPRIHRGGGHGVGKRFHHVPRVHRGGGHGFGKRFHHIPRIHRGGRIHSFWFGPQFHIRNWGTYGFPAPLHDDWRWVRHYDDAYLIDREGRVHDSRYGMEWDRYGERWEDDERGIPAYRGDEDYDLGDDGEEWPEEHEGRYEEEDVEVHGDGGGADYEDRGARYGHHGGGGCQVTYSYDSRHPAPPPPPPPCAGGYGYGYGGGVVVVETTVTTAPTVTEHVVYEEVVRKKVRKHKPKRKYHRAPEPAPYHPGEKG